MASAAPTTDRVDRPDLPQVFGRYLLLKRLSRGGMGEIFLAKLGEIQGFEKPVIIKKVLPQLAADEEFVKRFIDEAQVAIKLNHANIAPVYEVGKVDGDYFLAIEYLEGRDLRRLVGRCSEERFRLPPDLCMYIGRELANGLGYAHRRTDTDGNALALVHCDISPPNVMVSFEGEVKIIDFGIAKSAIRIAGSNPNIGFGKFGYMAPEQLVKGGIVDRRTDIYAAGVVLYELLTGERLFQFPEGADYRQIARIVTRGEFIPPSKRVPGIDPSLDPIVGRALASKAAERYQTAEEFRDAIQAKLSQMNPTISSDALAALMRRLFAEEIIDERALIAQTSAVDVGDYQEEIAGSVGHTVTFARAGLGPRRPTQPISAALPVVHSSSRAVAIGGLVGASVLVGGLVAWLAVHGSQPVAAGTVPQPVVAVAPQTNVPPSGAVPGAPTPSTTPSAEVVKLTPLAPPPSAATGPHRPRRAPPTPPGTTPPSPSPPPVVGARVDPGDPDDAPPVRSSPVLSREDEIARMKKQVTPKFLKARQEYDRFKEQYGEVLSSEWGELMLEITKPETTEHFHRLESLIERVRKDMTRVRGGG